ncbi:carbonic anhydrase [Candidatus Lokiarchaeum ossiferum]|uniref:carbonic anhydrase n=1 Tax=Candidatus Lokiarchaeum ossiferum TaxID=2951803 RepID=UPI00352DC3D0
MFESIEHVKNSITEKELKNLLLHRNRQWMYKKDGSSTVNGSLKTVVLSCIDSRVPVEKIFQAKPGELLVLKNAGNLITDDMFRSALVASVELGAKFFIVLGHTRCGMAIKNNPTKIDHISSKISQESLNKLASRAKKDVIEWFGFFNQNEWNENATTQAEKLQELLDETVSKDLQPTILKAIYDLDSGEVTFI